MGVLLFLLLLLYIYIYIFFNYWDLELMPLSATKRCHPNSNKAYSSTRLLILNVLTM